MTGNNGQFGTGRALAGNDGECGGDGRAVPRIAQLMNRIDCPITRPSPHCPVARMASADEYIHTVRTLNQTSFIGAGPRKWVEDSGGKKDRQAELVGHHRARGVDARPARRIRPSDLPEAAVGAGCERDQIAGPTTRSRVRELLSIPPKSVLMHKGGRVEGWKGIKGTTKILPAYRSLPTLPPFHPSTLSPCRLSHFLNNGTAFPAS